MNILITGSNGQLGNELRKISGNYLNYRFFFTDVAELDIANPEAVDVFFEKNSIQTVINCAAYTAVDKAESEKSAAMLINARAVEYLSNACYKSDATLIHVSTDYVYNGCAHKPYNEDDPTDPVSVYGRTKLAGEYVALKTPKSAVIRTSWLYSSFGANFVKTMLCLGKERETLNVVFDQVGTPTYAADLAFTIMEMVKAVENNEFISGVFNYSNEGVCSWYDFALEIMQQAGLKCAILPIETKDYPTPATRPHYSVMNKARIKTAYRLMIPHWKDSLIRCLEEIGR